MGTTRQTRRNRKPGGCEFLDRLIKVVSTRNHRKHEYYTGQRFSTFERCQTRSGFCIMTWIAMTPAGTIPCKWSLMKHNLSCVKQTNCQNMTPLVSLPVVVVISEEAASGHINVLLLLFLLLLLLFLLRLSRSGSSSSGSGSSTNTCPSVRNGKSTRSGNQVQNVLLSEVGSEHHRPVGSNGVSGGLHDLVQVVLLQLALAGHSYGHIDLGISAQKSGERNNELLLLSSRHRFKGSHDG